MIKFEDGEWEFGQSISDLATMVGPCNTERRVVESITVAHNNGSSWNLGFSVTDDVVLPRSGVPVRLVQPPGQASAAADAPQPPQPEQDVVPAAEDAELPVDARDDSMDHQEVWVDGTKLDSNSFLRTFRAACETLGLPKSGGKQTCLKRLWSHLQTQEMLAAHSVHHQLQDELARPVHSQPVPDEPSEEERARHCLTHQPFAPWCELCVAHCAVQDPHKEQEHSTTSHSCVSFDFGYSSRLAGEDTSCALNIHDRDTGAMHVLPTPAKGGRYLNYLCTEFCRFLI